MESKTAATAAAIENQKLKVVEDKNLKEYIVMPELLHVPWCQNCMGLHSVRCSYYEVHTWAIGKTSSH